jgi:predicted nucleotide-binding protein (sugar kinase/HSP70/actin superfamily)
MRYMLDHGANTLLMVGGKGYCRLGWYAQVQERLLRNIGYEFDMFVADTPLPLKTKWPAFRDLFKRVSGNASWLRIASAVYMGYQMMSAMDRAETLAHRLRAFERQQGATNQALDRFFHHLSRAEGVGAIRRLERDFLEETAAIETEDTHPVKVGITGEIWVVLEQAVTRDIERWLGARNHPRVWVEREHSASEWFRLHCLRLPAEIRREQYIVQAAKPWLSQWVGGHGTISIGHLALAREAGWDGMIHIFPFTCMPEIIAQNIIVSMAEKLDMPVLTYIVSEQTGEAGIDTRLESFLDLLEERRLSEQNSEGRILQGI